MSTKRAKQHKRDVFLDVRTRKFWKMFEQAGLGNRYIRQFAERPHKFRKRAFKREKELEKITKSKTEPLGILHFVNPPAGWQPTIRGEGEKHDD